MKLNSEPHEKESNIAKKKEFLIHSRKVNVGWSETKKHDKCFFLKHLFYWIRE